MAVGRRSCSFGLVATASVEPWRKLVERTYADKLVTEKRARYQ